MTSCHAEFISASHMLSVHAISHSDTGYPDTNCLYDEVPKQVRHDLAGKKRAENGIRTRGLQFGKLMLYRLSYFRFC